MLILHPDERRRHPILEGADRQNERSLQRRKYFYGTTTEDIYLL
jgi:hypothetical protein